MRRLMFGESGSVNVYAILIIVPVFLFHAVMIDWLRVFMAAKDSENAVKAGARSVLSDFDSSLRPYGLFGLRTSGDDLKSSFSGIASANLHHAAPGVFSLIDPMLEKQTEVVSRAGSLANRSVLERQIEQEMKYRAPVEFALELTEKWKKTGLSGQVKGASSFSQAAGELEALLDKREKALDDAWTASQRYTNTARTIYQKEEKTLDDLHSLAEQIGLVDLDELNRSIRDVEKQLEGGYETLQHIRSSVSSAEASLSDLLKKGKSALDDVARLREQISQLEQEASTIESSLSELESRKSSFTELLQKAVHYFAESALSKSVLNTDYELLRPQLEPVVSRLSEARKWNNELSVEKETQLHKLKATFPDAAAAFASIRIYSFEMFSGYETEAGKISAQHNGIRQKWQDTVWFVGDAYDMLSDSLAGFDAQVESFRSDIERQEQERAAFNLERTGRKQEQTKKTKQAMQLAVSQMTGCVSESKEIYERLKPLYERYKTFAGDESETEPAVPLDHEAYDGKSAMSLGARIMDALAGVRNELYTDEYILEKFSYRTNAGPATFASHPISRAEVEYLIYGLSSCSLNYSASYGEMFLLLLAVRTTEVLLSPQQGIAAIGSPLLLFLTALAEGAVQAVVDMNKLVNGESIPLIKKVPGITVSYKDFLRLFLLLHGGNKNVMSRLQALVQLNTGTDLGDAYTYIQASAETSVRLWFASRLFGLLHRADLSPCVPVQGRCRILSTAVAAYG